MDAAKLGTLVGEAAATALIGLVLGLLAKVVVKVSGKPTDTIKLTRWVLGGAAFTILLRLQFWR